MGTDITTFKKHLGAMIEREEFALPTDIDANTFRNAALVAFQTNAEIRKCSPESVFTSLRHLAGVGLMPDGREAAIVRFGDKAQAMPMVWGIVKSVKRSGSVVSLWAEIVYEGESLETWVEDGELKFNHVNEDGSRLNPMKRNRSQVIGAYAVAKMTDGSIEFEPMDIEQIEKRRMASPNQRSKEPTGIWKDWYEEQAKKTVIRSLCKRLPMSAADKNRILDKDPTMQAVEAKDVTPAETTEERLKRLKAEREEEVTDPIEEVMDAEVIPDPEEDAA